MQAIAEAVVLGEKACLDRQLLFEVLSKTAIIAPAHPGKLAKAQQHNYQLEFAVGLMNEDFRLLLDTAAAAFPINNVEFTGHPDYDFCAGIDRMEDLARINFARRDSRGETN